MKEQCLKCQSPLQRDGEAFICSYECTYCGPCTEGMKRVCPNCQGELVIRPRRLKNG